MRISLRPVALMILFSLLFGSIALAQQNLVPNPSFESNPSSCNWIGGDLTMLPAWEAPTVGTSDYFHPCNTRTGNVGIPATQQYLYHVPDNSKGIQQPRTGKSYIGCFFWPGGSGKKEYVEAKLKEPLCAGQTYRVTFYVNMADNHNEATDQLGAYVSKQKWTNNNVESINVTPQFKTPAGQFFTNKNGWDKVTGTFVAQGGEQFIIIGSFGSLASTSTKKVSGPYSNGYYFVEDVSLIIEGNFSVDVGPDVALGCGETQTTITANANGGTGSYSYKWNTGANSKSITVGPGAYTVTATSPCGYEAFDKIVVTADGGPKAEFKNLERCDGQRVRLNGTYSTGAITNWEWDFGDGANSKDPDYTFHTYSKAGIYKVTLTVTDGGGCKDTFQKDVVIHAAPQIQTTSNDAACGKQDGEAGVSNPQTGDTYVWDNGATTAIITGLDAGVYTVTVTNSGGCKSTADVEVKSTSGMGGSVERQHVSCFGGNDGSINALPTGGTKPYQYVWDNGQTTQTATGLSAGNYKITVTDANNCVISATIAVEQPDSLTGTALPTSNVSCIGGSDGTAVADISGGTPPYTYKYSNGQTTAVATGLSAGDYTLEITDSLGCKVTQQFTVSEPGTPLSISTVQSKPTTCDNSGAGEAAAIVSGGTAPYSYAWTDGQTTDTATGLQAGTYQVVVKDSLGCEVTGSVNIERSGSLNVKIDQSFQAECDRQGGTRAEVLVNVSGGAGSYSYEWDAPGSQGDSLVILPAGTWHVNVKDKTGCEATDSVTIDKIIQITVVDKKEPSCPTCNDGEITVSVSGDNTPPYTYRWNDANQQTTATASGLSNGTYKITVFDDASCFDHLEILLGECQSVDTSVTSNGEFLVANDSNVTYQWVDCGNNYEILSGETGQKLFPNAPWGTYAVIVGQGECADTSSCYYISRVGIEENANEMAIRLYPNPSTGLVVLQIPPNLQSQNLALKIYNMHGDIVYSQIANILTGQAIDLSMKSSGLYFVEIQSGNFRVVERLQLLR